MMTESKSGDDESAPPHADWPKVMEWIEKQGQESLKARFATADLIAKDAQTTLTVLLAGVGGSAAYAAKVFEPVAAEPVAVAFAAVCAYLVVLSISLVLTCMMFRSYPALSQDPKNLLQSSYSLDALREVELENLSDRIDDARKLNADRARRLNYIRIATALSPLLFVAVAVLAQRPAPLAPQHSLTVVCEQSNVAPTPSSSTSAASGAAATPTTSFNCHFGK
jgi:hypothetical protein